jgi:translation initiation factor IF-2
MAAETRAQVRVYQLAKELNVQSALILELLDRLGKDVRSDLSGLDADTADLVRLKLTAAIEREKKRLAEEERVRDVGVHDETTDASDGDQPAAVAAADHEHAELPLAAAANDRPADIAQDEPLHAAAAPGVAAAQGAASEVAPAETGVPAAPQVMEPRRPRVFAAKRAVPLLAPARPRPGVGVPPRPGSRPPLPGRPMGGAPMQGRPLGGAPMPGRPMGGPPRTGPGPVPAPGAPRPAGAPGAPGAPATPGAGRRKEKRDKDRERLLDVPAVSRPKPDLPPVPEKIVLSEAVTVKELAEKLNRKSKDVIAKLLQRGIFANINQPLDPTMAVELALEFGSEATVISFEQEAQTAVAAVGTAEAGTSTEDRPEDRVPRPPVVTVMGHVDHGKTSLLDAIRETNVVAGEHGGITQHIGAYQVEEKGRKITFLDTPGHEAFTLMRARGARVTDIVVLVVAADDGVKPQTVEAIDHARAAGVPIVVAINKVDKPDARPDRVKQQLADRDLLVEQYGGQTVSCEVSAKKRQGIEELLEMILLVADLKEVKANPNKSATGVVLEAKLDRNRGVVATVLVQDGTLKVGDPFIVGSAYGKVRAMTDEHGRRVDSVGPATPVEVMGFAGEPGAGDLFQVVADEAKARQIASYRQEKVRAEALARTSRRSLEQLSKEIAEGNVKELTVLLKADVQGSLEALQKSLGELPQEKIRISILRASTGAITQADVLLATASDAIIVGFNVRPDRVTAELARNEEVEIRLYTVIYDAVNDMRQAMVGLLEPTLKESVLGQAEVRQLFRVPKVGVVAGCYIADGRVARTAQVRLIRDNVVIYTGKVGSLRRFKDDVSEVKQGFECGIGIEGYNDLKEGDVIEFFVVERVAAQTL